MDEPQVESELAESESQRQGGPWKLIVLVIVATAVGVWLVPGESPETTTEPAQTALAPSLLEDLPPTAAGGEPVLPETLEPAIIDDTPGARARARIAELRDAGQPGLDDAYRAAVEAQTDGRPIDAYLLYFYAAREGHADAALALALQADPIKRDPANSVFDDPDPIQAHKWYELAARNGSVDARQDLGELRSHVEQMAASGDPQAQRIALLWQ